jgi:hypothetical protein
VWINLLIDNAYKASDISAALYEGFELLISCGVTGALALHRPTASLVWDKSHLALSAAVPIIKLVQIIDMDKDLAAAAFGNGTSSILGAKLL